MSDADKTSGKRTLALAVDYKLTFSSDHGLRVLRHLMRRHGMMNSTFDSDPHTSAYLEGQRAVVIEIMKKLRIDVKKLETEIFKEPQGESDVII
tara:strand:+ start:708 stop:989 length:282 start_codon:yes stop_codon:yes gene_type:complete